MRVEKLDLNLREEIRIRREQVRAQGERSEALGEFRVSIELVESIDTMPHLPRAEALDRARRQAEVAQSGLVMLLRARGVSDFEQQTLSNSLAANLTLAQIDEVSERDEVKMIRLSRVVMVTA